MDTIFALASGRGKAGVAVIRISGRGAWPAVQSLAGDLPVPRRASLRRLRDRSGQELDQALVVLFPAGASFTGEDVAELQLHGSPAVVAAVSEALAAEPDLRPAEPGEFTRRALQNGRLDLAQVEGLADLINAETEAQRLQAQRLFDGALGERVMAWRASLLRASSLIVAAVDFAEEDVPQDVRAACAAEISGVRDALVAEQEGAFFAERVRDGFEIAIVGPPNAGKSTLLNYLAGREAALTSEQAGTTRDVIEVRMDLGGLPVTLLDMAGLRETEDAVEAAGVGGGRGGGAGGAVWGVVFGLPPVCFRPPPHGGGGFIIPKKK
jgi:tRNA modification GTPase